MAFPDEDAWDMDAPAAESSAAEPKRRRSERRSSRSRSERKRPTASFREPPIAPSGPRVPILDWPAPELDPDGDDETLDLSEEESVPSGALFRSVFVQVPGGPRAIACDPGQLVVNPGDPVVVETDHGPALGTVIRSCCRVLAKDPPKRLLRLMDGNDQRQRSRNQLREREAFEYCRERIAHRRLPMKLIRVDYVHGGNKAVFFFAAENRIDFRDLVKDLAQRLHTRIVMRQVGVRDESKMTGGIGSCGCELCCSTWLPKFEPVSIRMAKDQGLVLNPQKVSGQCGRLKCCLTYEQQQYQESRKNLPKPGRRVRTPQGEGKVQELDVLRRLVRVFHSDGTIETYRADQLQSVVHTPAKPSDE